MCIYYHQERRLCLEMLGFHLEGGNPLHFFQVENKQSFHNIIDWSLCDVLHGVMVDTIYGLLQIMLHLLFFITLNFTIYQASSHYYFINIYVSCNLNGSLHPVTKSQKIFVSEFQ